MVRTLQWILAFTAVIIINAAKNDERADRKLVDIDYSDVMSIDCGVKESYADTTTPIQYQADDMTVVQFGEINNVLSNYTFDNMIQIKKQLKSLRSFPDGKRNCYALKPKLGRNKKYSIRAYFAYGNYDNSDRKPTFDVHLGVNFLVTIVMQQDDAVLRYEVIQFSSTDTIEFCLVNINKGVPFISLLELWPVDVDNSLYPDSLLLQRRRNLGRSIDNSDLIRYPDDIFGRSWFTVDYPIANTKTISYSLSIDLDNLDDPYKLPTNILNTATEALSLADPLDIIVDIGYDNEYYVYLHFCDFWGAINKTRIMSININESRVLIPSALVIILTL